MKSYTYPYQQQRNRRPQMGGIFDFISDAISGITGAVTGVITTGITTGTGLIKTLGPEYLAKVSGLTDTLNSNIQQIEKARLESSSRGYTIQAVLKNQLPALVALQDSGLSSRANSLKTQSSAIMQTAFTLANSLLSLRNDLQSKAALITASPTEAANYATYLTAAINNGGTLVAKVAINKQDFDKWWSSLQRLYADWKAESTASYIKQEGDALLQKARDVVKSGEALISSSPYSIPLAIGAGLFLYMMVNKRR